MKRFAWVLVLAASILWGAMGTVTRFVAGIGFHTRQTAAVRICSAAVCLVLFLAVTDRKKLKIDRKDLKWFLGTGLGSLFVNNLCYAEVVQRASLSVAVVLLYTAPFFVMLLSFFIFKEKLTIQKIAALLLSFAGCVLVVGLSGGNAGEKPFATLAIGLCAGLSYGLYSIFGKVLVGKYDSITVTTYTFIIAAIATFLISEPADMFLIIGENMGKMPLVVIGSVITLAMPYIFYSTALKYMESSRASIIASFEVVAASLFGVMLFGETLSPWNVAGITLVVAALVLLQAKAGE